MPPSNAEVVLTCEPLTPTLDFLCELGFRLDTVSPADEPHTAVVSGHGLTIRLVSGSSNGSMIRIHGYERDETLVAPNGTRIELCGPPSRPSLRPEHVVTCSTDQWTIGRAGMRYRDLIPSRLGGYLIASHIAIPAGGPVPDYVHYHDVAFQLIYCYRGWVRVVYQDQGEPFVMRPGDCVLQPPTIRHRVLECSPGLEVLEVTSPAEHETHRDHDLELPNGEQPGRTYGGQPFARHIAESAAWQDGVRDLGIRDATGGVVGARVLRAPGRVPNARAVLWFVLEGTLQMEASELTAGDCAVFASGVAVPGSSDLELLEVVLP